MKFCDYFRRSLRLWPLEKPAEPEPRFFSFQEIYHKEETEKSWSATAKDRLWIVYARMMCSEAGSTPFGVVFGDWAVFPEIVEIGMLILQRMQKVQKLHFFKILCILDSWKS